MLGTRLIMISVVAKAVTVSILPVTTAFTRMLSVVDIVLLVPSLFPASIGFSTRVTVLLMAFGCMFLPLLWLFPLFP